MNRLAAALLFACLTLRAAGGRAADDSPSLREALALEAAMQQAIQEVEPAVACILVARGDNEGKLPRAALAQQPRRPGGPDPTRRLRLKQFGREAEAPDLADRSTVPESYGSGVVVGEADNRLLVLTHYHVVRDAARVYVRLAEEKGSYADVYAADPRSDLAVLRLAAPVGRVAPVKFGDGGQARKGQWVLSIAHPFAAGFRDGSPSASRGIISNLRRRPASQAANEQQLMNRTLAEFGTLLETDARLNLGCSGGALVNLRGEVIGLTTALAAVSGSDTAGGFALPFDAPVRRIVEVLKQGREVEYGFLGVAPARTAPSKEGVRVEQVTPGTPAFRAGLRQGDVIQTVNGQRVRENDDLFLHVGLALAGTETRIDFLSSTGLGRATLPKSTRATLAKFRVEGKVIAANRPSARGVRVDYTSLLMQPQSFLAGLPAGVLVGEVQADSQAAAVGLRANDVISHVNGREVHLPAEFYELARQPGPLELTLASSDPGKPAPKVTID